MGSVHAFCNYVFTSPALGLYARPPLLCSLARGRGYGWDNVQISLRLGLSVSLAVENLYRMQRLQITKKLAVRSDQSLTVVLFEPYYPVNVVNFFSAVAFIAPLLQQRHREIVIRNTLTVHHWNQRVHSTNHGQIIQVENTEQRCAYWHLLSRSSRVPAYSQKSETVLTREVEEHAVSEVRNWSSATKHGHTAANRSSTAGTYVVGQAAYVHFARNPYPSPSSVFANSKAFGSYCL